MNYKSAVIQPVPDESGRWILAYTAFDFNDIMAQFDQQIKNDELKKGVEFGFTIKGKIYLVDTLPKLLEFIAKNESYLLK